jgi:LmbE family N-acetylglucosaminyl deacetylase
MWRYLLNISVSWLASRANPGEPVPIGWEEKVYSSREQVARPSKLMIVAHPDDESLFGGEALTSASGWTVVCVTNGTHEQRRRDFIAAMTSIGANYTMLSHFDHLGSGNFNVRLEEQLRELVAEFPYEMVVTHNASGEYSHPQHRAVHQFVRRVVTTQPLYVFGHSWLSRPRMSAAKRALIAHYESERRSIDFVRPLASRERLRRIQ